MWETWVYSLLSAFLVSIFSLLSIFFLNLQKSVLERIIGYFVSFSAGALFADAFVLLIPEAAKLWFSLTMSLFILFGIVASFVLEKFIYWNRVRLPMVDGHIHRFAVKSLIGDFLHHIIGWLVIGASYLISIEVWIAATLAALLHEVPQAITDFEVLLRGGFSRSRAVLSNFLSSLSILVGVSLVLILAYYFENITYFLIPFSAGAFVYIAWSDLVPELHGQKTFWYSSLQILMFLFGVWVMMLFLFF
jgi:zinc and cadmium transporter